MMRITNTMMSDSVIRNINNNMKRLNDTQEVTSTGEKIQQASEDPVSATKALKYRSYISQIEQYQSNAADATSWMEVTEDALSSLTKVMQNIRELTSEASSDALSGSDYSDIAEEISQLQDSALELLNTQYAGRYIFGGYNTDEAPYELTTVTFTDASTGDTTEVSQITFKGAYLSKYGVVSSDVSATDLLATYTSDPVNAYSSASAQSITYNTGYSSNTAVNVEGQAVSGTGVSNLFNTINKLLLGLEAKANDDDPSFQSVTGLSGSATSVTSTYSAKLSGAISPTYGFASGDCFTLTVDGSDYTVDMTGVTDLASLQTAIDTATGDSNAVQASENSKGGLTLAASDATTLTLTDSAAGDVLSDLGFDATTTDYALDDLLDDIDVNLESISTATAGLGARMNYVETCTSRLASDYTTYTGLLSSVLDADLSVATTNYATAQTIYDASLTVGAKVIKNTLVDYLT